MLEPHAFSSNQNISNAEYIEQAKTQAALITQATEREKALSRQRALVNIANKIRQSFDLKTICQTATDEVQHLLEVDRATIYRFNSDWSGHFLFESRAAGWKPLVGVMPTIEDSYLMETHGGRYAYNETFAVNDIYQAGHSDCHIALLEEFQARAYAIAPIFQEGRLWGLLTAFQNSEPCCWHEDEVQLLAQIGEQLGIALQQAEYVERIQAQTEELNQTLQALQQSQLKLIQQEKMASLGQLVAGVAHEINNPVNFIHANLNHVHTYAQNVLILIALYQKHYPQAPPEIQEQAEGMDLDFILEDLPKTLASMKLGTDRIRQIVLSLRNFSRLDESEFKTVDIHEGIDSTLVMLGHRLKNTIDRWSIEVVKNYGKLPLIKCYPAKLNQVFMNLLANAIDAIEDAVNHGELGANTVDKPLPTIWISTQLTEFNQVEVRIRDNGLGIPDHVKTQIFDQFFTTKTVGKGTGLGLAISLQIITEKHYGTLQVNSEPGRGAEFIIHLPTELVSNQ
ncbi:MAG: sensor histidine kinase [Microcoleaceae cyanobacterium]